MLITCNGLINIYKMSILGHEDTVGIKVDYNYVQMLF